MPAIALRAALSILLYLLTPVAFAQPVTWNDDFGPVTFEHPPRRVVVLDWGLVEQLLAIGVTPVGVGEPDGYRRWVSIPELPASVADVGARREPNLEAMSQLRPDLILATPEYTSILPLLNAVAPTMLLATFDDHGQPLQRSRHITTLLGRMLGHEAQADALLKRVDKRFAEARAALAGQAREPLYLVTFLDERHLRVNGGQGLYQAVLDQLGLRNAWQGPTSSWGFATITLSALATPADARLVLFEPLPDRAVLDRNPIWKALSAVREQRVDSLPAVWPYGGVSSAERLALLLQQRFAPSAQP
ncbi:ABC transporter substrate-binding protein [Pseudomonas akapageensis]|uniref:ABC transporter substrate-binding protein n=1 Tax=Pseudomonas akapageensis TaxID=2609961 RepID=UPI00140B31C7|nr:ABC transporter substrate-binding protein [Pseudomonas akapageensis]